MPGQRYAFRWKESAQRELHARAWPHKWRGVGRSKRHIKMAMEYLRIVETRMNSQDVYDMIDKEMAERRARGFFP